MLWHSADPRTGQGIPPLRCDACASATPVGMTRIARADRLNIQPNEFGVERVGHSTLVVREEGRTLKRSVNGLEAMRQPGRMHQHSVNALARDCAIPRDRTERRRAECYSILLNEFTSVSSLAERVGFEPTVRLTPHTRFPVVPVQPLLHLSARRAERFGVLLGELTR